MILCSDLLFKKSIFCEIKEAADRGRRFDRGEVSIYTARYAVIYFVVRVCECLSQILIKTLANSICEMKIRRMTQNKFNGGVQQSDKIPFKKNIFRYIYTFLFAVECSSRRVITWYK